jgi:hypothetical protein
MPGRCQGDEILTITRKIIDSAAKHNYYRFG